MKQKSANDEIVTRGILQDALKNHPTKKDLADALKNHPTKKDLADALKNHPTKVEMDMNFEESEWRVDEKARGYRDEILTKMDQIVGELAQIREDRLFEEHEKREIDERLTKLELAVAS